MNTVEVQIDGKGWICDKGGEQERQFVGEEMHVLQVGSQTPQV